MTKRADETIFGPLGDGTWRGLPDAGLMLDELELGWRVALGLEDEYLGFGALFDAQVDWEMKQARMWPFAMRRPPTRS